MWKEALWLFLVVGVAACGDDNEYICIDVIEGGDDMAGLSNRDDFIGVEACYYVFADPQGCEADGGAPSVMGEYGESQTCTENGFSVSCGPTYLRTAEDCPEGYVAE